MDEVKSTYDIELTMESTGVAVIDSDTVAILDNETKMYGIYVKGHNEALWWLKMTTLTLDNIMER